MPKLIRKSKLTGQPPETLLYEGRAKSKQIEITVFDYDEHAFLEKDVSAVEECISFRDTPSVTWLNVDGVHRIDILEKLTSCYEIHHLVLEDILNINQRPKMEDFGEYVYIVAKMLTFDAAKDDIADEQVSMILGKNFLISFQEEKQGDVFDGIRQRIRTGKGRIRKMGADYLTYALLDAIVDSYFTVLERISERVEALEETLIANPGPAVLHTINKLKRNLIFLRKSVWPLREVVHGLTQVETNLLTENAMVYYRDIYDHVIQVVDTIEAFRDTVSGMLDIYLSSLSHKLNQIIKVLTIIATIFMPLTFIAGIYGMNFNSQASPYNMPELNWRYGYFFALGIMAAVACGMIFYFKRKKWF